MGIPGFFHFLQDRYPCVIEQADAHHSGFDNFYLDVSSIIHLNYYKNISLEDYLNEVFHNINNIVHLVRPKKLIYLAIDGSGPSAKKRLQRAKYLQNHFRSKVTENKEDEQEDDKDSENEEEELPIVGLFKKVSQHLKSLIKFKVTTDEIWNKCKIVLDGSYNPGEAEIKIMDYIRVSKYQPDYDVNARHCLYGLDSDLNLIGLCTHELNFTILREAISFGRIIIERTEDIKYWFIHLGLLREYIEMDFDELKAHVQYFDINKVVDDFIFISVLLSNDYMPSLPCIPSKRTKSFFLLFQAYIKVYPKLGGNINENGTLNLERLEIFFKALDNIELEQFEQNCKVSKAFNNAKIVDSEDDAKKNNDEDVPLNTGDVNDTCELTNPEQEQTDCPTSENVHDSLNTYKLDYYKNKLNFVNSDQKQKHIYSYIKSLQWVLDYYYKGIQSWKWTFQYDYAPFISDLRNIKDFVFNYELEEPLLPYAQSMATLCSELILKHLPKAYHELITDPNSELRPYFPEHYSESPKINEFIKDGILVIPFMDEKILLNAMQRCECNLTPEEKALNCFGPIYQYSFTSKSQGELVPSTDDCFFKLSKVFCEEKSFWPKEFHAVSETIASVKAEDCAIKPYFPTFRHLKFKFEKRYQEPKCSYENGRLILLPEQPEHHDDLNIIAEKYLNKVVYIGWPYLTKALVMRVANREFIITTDGTKRNFPDYFENQLQTAKEHMDSKMGINISNCEILVFVRIYDGSIVKCSNQTGVFMREDCWSRDIINYPLYTILSEEMIPRDNDEIDLPIEKIYKPNSPIIYLGSTHFGSVGHVIDPMPFYTCGRIKVEINIQADPDFTMARNLQHSLDQEYLNQRNTAEMVGISYKCVSFLTGSILVHRGKRRELENEKIVPMNIGLKFRFPKQFKERANLCRRVDREWYFSKKAISLLKEYKERFSNVLEYIDNTKNEKFCFASDLYDENADMKVANIYKWIRKHHIHYGEIIPSNSRIIDRETLDLLVDSEVQECQEKKTIEVEAEPHLLLTSKLTHPSIYKCNIPISLFDPVVIVQRVPHARIGSRGIVIGIYPDRTDTYMRLDRVGKTEYFYEIFLYKTKHVAYQVPESAILVIKSNEMKAINLNNRSTNWRALPPQQQGNVNNDSKRVENPVRQQGNVNNDSKRVENPVRQNNGNTAGGKRAQPQRSQNNVDQRNQKKSVAKQEREKTTHERNSLNKKEKDAKPLISWRTNKPI